MGFILSCSTIPPRVDKLVHIIKNTTHLRYKYFIINVCVEYKRFGKYKISKELIKLSKSNKRIIFNIINDFGPICKLIGAFKLVSKLQHNKYDKIIIIDDDTTYHPDLFYDLVNNKTKDNITTGSGFNFENEQYNIVEGKCDVCEGYGGICFDVDQLDDFILWYVMFYKHFNFKQDDEVSKYLQASFLGDDFIISNIYPKKEAIQQGRRYINPQQYGFTSDALHQNNVFGSNMGSYKYLNDNIDTLNTFKNKYRLNKSIHDEIPRIPSTTN